MNYTIKKATACYTGGGIYIYYGQLENGLYFRTWDDCETAYICDSDTSAEEAEYNEFYELHTVEELTGEAFEIFWNETLLHIINGKPAFDKWNNYQKSDLERRIIM
jgi:hypothetical protein